MFKPTSTRTMRRTARIQRTGHILEACVGATLALSLIIPFAWALVPGMSDDLPGSLATQAAFADDLGTTTTGPTFDPVVNENANIAGKPETPSSSLDSPEATTEHKAGESAESQAETNQQAQDTDMPDDAPTADPGESTTNQEGEPPSGPDMTKAEETGVPMANGISADPPTVLRQVVEARLESGFGAVLQSLDDQTGVACYE